MPAPKSLIINTPYDCPAQHWEQASDGTLNLIQERRKAGYEIIDTRSNTRRTEELKLVNEIRTRLGDWREADYTGITSVTVSRCSGIHEGTWALEEYRLLHGRVKTMSVLASILRVLASTMVEEPAWSLHLSSLGL